MLLWVQERKVQILMAIHPSLPVIAEEVILQAAWMPDADVAVITGVATSSLGEIRGVTAQSFGAHIGSLVHHWITTDFLHPLALPAECLWASDEDSTTRTEAESGSSERLWKCVWWDLSSSLGFLGCEPEPLHCMLLAKTWFPWPDYSWSETFYFQSRLIASCTYFMQRQDILLDLYPEHVKTSSLLEDGASIKDY